MKKLLIFFFLVTSAGAFACDEVLQPFPRDCSLQDRLRAVKAALQAKGIDADEVAEYRALRFIDRGSWEKAKAARTAPMRIYDPAPATWEVWDAGIRQIFTNPGMNLDNRVFTEMNRVLLTNGSDNIKDPNTDRKKRPGEFRTGDDLGIGFCHRNVRDSSGILANARRSSLMFQKNWELKTGINFKQLVIDAGGQNADEATMAAAMTQSPHPNCTSPNSWVNFVPTKEVQQQLSWLRIFTGMSLQLISEKKPAPSPVELAAFVQRWFVTIHPFSDGNGRTSRAVQDILLFGFELPFAPAGDLYNDATIEWESYLEQTYRTMESMLGLLENCAQLDYSRPLSERAFACATVDELNRH
jgi:hypothetical protein